MSQAKKNAQGIKPASKVQKDASQPDREAPRIQGAQAQSNPHIEDACRIPFGVRSTDLRDTIGVSTAAMSDILKKAAARYLDGSETKTGAARTLHPDAVRAILANRGFLYPLDQRSRTAHIIAIQITKGGAAKTTTSYVLATRMSAFGARVLLVDADPQGNLTTAFELEKYGLEIDEGTAILSDLFDEPKRGEAPITASDLVIKITPNLHLIPSTLMNSNLELTLQRSRVNVESVFRQKFAALVKQYDYIIFDCAPALSSTNAAIACFANTVLLPVYPDKLCISGLTQTLGEIERLKTEWPTLRKTMNERIVFGRFDAREVTSVHYLNKLFEEYPEKLYCTFIRTSSELKNAIHFGRGLYDSGRRTGVAEDFDKLVKLIIGLDGVSLRKKPPTRRNELARESR